MSFLVGNRIDRAYVARINQETRILKSSKIDWNIEDVTRFASLLKIEQSIAAVIETQAIDGEMLFNLNFFATQLELATDQTNFLPVSKLFFVANAILELTRQQQINTSLETDEPCNAFFSKEAADLQCEEKSVEVEEEVVRRLKEELRKMNDVGVIQLSSMQLYRMIKNAELMQLLDFKDEDVELIRRWNVDGFSLVCTVASEGTSSLIRNYFSDEDLSFLRTLSTVFLHLYYSQFWQELQMESENQITSVAWQDAKQEGFGIDFLDLEDLPVKASLGKSEYDIEEDDPRASGYAASVAGSAIRQSILGVSERGSIKNSEYEVSERGSVRYSMAGSVYASSEMMDDEMSTTINESRSKDPQVSSSISGDDNAQTLVAASLSLPFNLLNLEPLQRIKIATMAYPFPIQKALPKKDRPEHESDTTSHRTESIYDWISESDYVSERARFGRSPENDFSYPDELSISGKHAQIVFRDESYYIRDLGSKTGTFLYISAYKPLVLTEEQIIQLSYEVELKVVIVKSDMNEGVIKFEFKKPDNEPPYRAILKNHNTVRIGKAEKSHIRLLNQSISSYHAEIRYEQGRFLMYDCNTRTGTWLRLSPKGVRSNDRKLSKNDIFRISSKKTFLVEDLTEQIRFESHCPLASMVQ